VVLAAYLHLHILLAEAVVLVLLEALVIVRQVGLGMVETELCPQLLEAP
jgi:hypothetical protein